MQEGSRTNAMGYGAGVTNWLVMKLKLGTESGVSEGIDQWRKFGALCLIMQTMYLSNSNLIFVYLHIYLF